MRVPNWIVPLLVVVAAGAGIGVAQLFAIPTLEIDLAPGRDTPGDAVTVSLVVRGVRCADTARTAAEALEGVDGTFLVVAYASRGQLDVTFDPTAVSREEIVAAVEGPVYNAETGEFLFGVYEVITVN